MKGERQKHEGRKAEAERTVGRGKERRKAEARRMGVRDRTDELKAEAGLAKDRSRKDDTNVDRQR